MGDIMRQIFETLVFFASNSLNILENQHSSKISNMYKASKKVILICCNVTLCRALYYIENAISILLFLFFSFSYQKVHFLHNITCILLCSSLSKHFFDFLSNFNRKYWIFQFESKKKSNRNRMIATMAKTYQKHWKKINFDPSIWWRHRFVFEEHILECQCDTHKNRIIEIDNKEDCEFQQRKKSTFFLNNELKRLTWPTCVRVAILCCFIWVYVSHIVYIYIKCIKMLSINSTIHFHFLFFYSSSPSTSSYSFFVDRLQWPTIKKY